MAELAGRRVGPNYLRSNLTQTAFGGLYVIEQMAVSVDIAMALGHLPAVWRMPSHRDLHCVHQWPFVPSAAADRHRACATFLFP